MSSNADESYYNFYESVDRNQVYTVERAEGFGQVLEEFVQAHNLRDKRLIEFGAGRGFFQDVVPDYVGVDISESLRQYYRDPTKLVVVSDGNPLPFPDNHFDAGFTYAVFEHVPSLEYGLTEFLRVVKPGGHILFHAAWQVRPWAARGLSVRPFKDLSFTDKLEKLTIPLRNSVPWRLLSILPSRIWRTCRYHLSSKDRWKIDYRKLEANYETFWQSDSDACNHIDIHAMIVWFLARGCEVIEYPTPLQAMKARSGQFAVRVRKPNP